MTTEVVTRWQLVRTRADEYRLTSHIENQPKGLSVVQTEQLDAKLVANSVSLELTDAKTEARKISVHCQLRPQVSCDGSAGKDSAVSSAPFKSEEPFLLYFDNVFAVDFAWLTSSAINMAHIDTGSKNTAVLQVFGGTAVLLGDRVQVAGLQAMASGKQTVTVIAPEHPIPWDIGVPEHETIELVGSEAIELNSVSIGAQHYRLKDEKGQTDMEIWSVEPGVICKIDHVGEEEGDVVLLDYKQYEPLIPTLPVSRRY
jgi:hypothetical protein